MTSVYGELIKASPSMLRLGFSLLFLSLSLSWQIRKTKKAFEKELVNGGMGIDDAKRLSGVFDALKANLWSLAKETGST